MARLGEEDVDLVSLLARLLEATREALAGEGAAEAVGRVDRVRAALDSMMRRRGEGEEPADRDALRADVAAIRDVLAESGTGAARGDMGRVAAALQSLLGWLEHGRPGQGAEVDSIVAQLEKTFGSVASPGARAAEKERDERIRSDVRASISERLRQAGIKPSGDS